MVSRYGVVERFRQRRRSARVRADMTCNVCGAPGTRFKTSPPWPGTAYSHTSYACDAHESYLHGHSWARLRCGEWRDEGALKSTCSDCRGPYGRCGCPRQALAQQYLEWERKATFGNVHADA